MKKITLILLLTIFTVISCSKLNEKPENAKPENEEYHIARYISYVSNNIFPDSPIIVKFVSPMIKVDEIGKAIESDIITISPKVKGKTVWKDYKTLQFIPNKELNERKRYKVKVDVKELSADLAKVADYQFVVNVKGREISFLDGDFIQTDDDKIYYDGTIKFTYHIEKEIVENEFNFYRGKNKLELIWEGKEKGKEFSFKTAEFSHEETNSLFKINLSKKKFQLSDDYEVEFSSYSFQEMKVVFFTRISDEINPAVEIEFSSVLDSQQLLDGLLTIEPNLSFKLKKYEKKVTVTGKFEYGIEYTLTINKNIRNKFAKNLETDYTKSFAFNDQKPQMTFSSDGCFLPSGNNKKLLFQTLNLKEVSLTVEKVFENNSGQFLQNNNLSSLRNEKQYHSEFRRVGINYLNKTLKIGEKRNEWLQHELDISKLIPNGDKGLYIIGLRFRKHQVLYRGADKKNRWNDYASSSPYSWRYYDSFGKVSKTVIISDIGLTWFKTENENIVYVTDLNTSKPISGANVKLMTYQNQVISEKKTNSKGQVLFPITKSEIFYVEAEHNSQRSFLKKNEMQWNLSTFSVDGVQNLSNKTRAYLYTERGVFRPGDEINISMIFRNKDNTFPENHPVNIEIKNPQNKVVLDYTMRKGKDGFYNFKYKTDAEDMTGNWEFIAKVGNSRFKKQLEIETVVAERLKIEIVSEKENIKADDKKIAINLKAKYLFGNPASNLKAKLTCSYYKASKRFEGYKSYIFENVTQKFEGEEKIIFDKKLNEKGEAKIVWKKPYFGKIPSAINLKLSAEVQEPGGRASKHWETIPIETYKAFVGIERPKSQYMKTNTQNPLNIILLNSQGYPLVGQEMIVKIYHNTSYWWWEFDNHRESKLHFKTNYETELISEISFKSTQNPYLLDFSPRKRGKYLIEVSHKTRNGHSAAIFVTSSYWGNAEGGMKNAGLLKLSSNKENYNPGETAIVQCPVPENANVLVSIDKGYKNLENYWLKASKNETVDIEIPVTSDMLPNIYCSVSVIQPHSQTDNDRPIRMFGVLPIMVEDSSTRQKLELTIPNELRPNQKFSCKVQTSNQKPAQFTIAIVDEGLLSLTDFQTPNAWKEFYKKLRLGVTTYDNYAYVIGANKGDIFKTFSVGGDSDYRKQQLSPTKANRFKPVSLFKGPIQTDENGFARIDFEMPEYIGAVRVMVISANEERFGRTEKTVPVKNELMVLATLPRVLAPGDKFQLPVTVFCLDDEIKNVEISLEIEELISCQKNSKKIKFSGKSNKDVFFDLTVKDEIGVAKIKIKAVSKKYQTESNTEIAIRPISPRIYHSEQKICAKGKSVNFAIPQKGIKGTNNSSITISKRKKVDFYKRLQFLIRYPYGCLEQTTSSGFPQLYLKNLMVLYDDSHEKIDSNINSTITRLRRFQKINGSFNYWRNGDTYYDWSDIYAGHFLIEAQKAGYFVPDGILENWKRNVHSITVKNSVEKIAINSNHPYHRNIYKSRIQIYRLFVLALLNEPEMGVMNLMNEINLKYLDDTERWQLAACYKLAGMDDVAEEIANKTGAVVKDYTEFAGSFGSSLRDKSIILNAMLILDKNEQARALYDDIVDIINGNQWHSTQTLAFSLLAIGKYMDKYSSDFDDTALMSGTITNSGFETIDFNSEKALLIKKVSETIGDLIKVNVDSKTETDNLIVTFNSDRIPLEPQTEAIGKGTHITRKWYDDNNNPIEPTHLKQGETANLKITVNKSTEKKLENVALVQILPSGWEIENERILDSNAYSKTSGNRNYGYRSRNNQFEQAIAYTDIRDDRIIWFFNMNRNVKTLEFKVKIRPVTVGEFYFSPTKCELMYSDKYKAVKSGFKVWVEK
ncbi:MAG: hypothetical protein K8S23_04650 [Candidatus Cloacimonetes bacterium]|nr:hypothetical protein [Candidatus Cloacimonadota bacterium]